MKHNAFILPLLLLSAIACTPEETPETPVTVNPPENVRLIQADGTSLAFGWQPSEGAEVYTARLETGEGKYVYQYETENTNAAANVNPNLFIPLKSFT